MKRSQTKQKQKRKTKINKNKHTPTRITQPATNTAKKKKKKQILQNKLRNWAAQAPEYDTPYTLLGLGYRLENKDQD